MSTVLENWRYIKDELDRLGVTGGVKVLGVTKGQPIDRVTQGVAAGIAALGDNYVQEGQKLKAQLPEFHGEWHFIGHIQSRKARDLVGYDCVESLDRMSVAEELDKRAGAAGRRVKVFAQVNVGEEETKSGVRPDELEGFLDSLKTLSNLEVEGLMALPPPLQPVDSRRPHFRRMRQLFDRFERTHGLKWLSLGTSEDYREAVSEGSNLIRLGTVLFGERH
jgi:PLP dependent protein